MKPRIISFLPAICWLLLSFYLLTLPGKSIPDITLFNKLQLDKVVHILMFGILVLLFLAPFKTQWPKQSFLITAILFAAFAIGYGIAMEFVQKYYIPNRSFDVWDIAADVTGSLIPVGWLYAKFRY